MKRKITFLLAALLLSCGLSWAQTTETLNIANYASANNWENSNQYLTATVGDVTFTATGGSNTGKYYSNDQSWRFYANENATLTITVPSGSTLVSVTPTFTIKDNGTLVYDGSTITSGSSVNVNGESAMFSISQSSGNKGKVFFTEIEVTYTSGATPTVAMPTFNPASGTEFGDEGLQVFITCATEGVDIYYTLDGSEPDDESISYSGPISLTETTTIKAIAYDGDENNSAVATATYTYVDPNAPGTENNPYTVAQARAAIDANVGTQGVYATGIVSAIPTAWSTQYNNITFNFVDNTGDTEFLQAYRCVSGTGVDASDVAVGDVVVVYGNLTKYQSTYEFAQNCTLVSLTHPTGYVEAPTFSPTAGTYDEAQNVTINCANANATIYYTLDGTEPTNASTPYTAAINIATTTTIKAVAYVGANASAVSTAEYAIVPVANISSITEVNTSYVVKGTVVATNSRGFIMGDGTGYVYYYNNGAVSQSVGDMVKVSGTTGTYGQIIQFTNTATVTEATTSNYNGTPAATVITEVPAESYIEKLERATKFFKDKIFRHPAELPIETYEGVQGFLDAIEFLKHQKPVEALQYSGQLSQACKDHAKDLGSKGLSSHEGSDGNGLSERIEKYIEWDGAVAENLDFCYKFAENIVMNLIVDDGSKEKHQRNNLFNPEFVYGGVGCDEHKTFKVVTVCNYAKGLHAIGEEPPDVINSVQDYIQKTMGKNNQPKNAFQIDDPDAPDNTQSVKIVKLKKIIGGEERNITRKIYLLDNGKQHMVEIEDKE